MNLESLKASSEWTSVWRKLSTGYWKHVEVVHVLQAEKLLAHYRNSTPQVQYILSRTLPTRRSLRK